MNVVAQPKTSAGQPSRAERGTLNQLFFEAIERYNKPDAIQVKVNGAYQPISHRTIAERARRVALGLSALGIPRGARVAILSENRPEWAIADYGCLTAGITDVPLYPSLPPEQIAYILRDSGAQAIFVSAEAQARKLTEIRASVQSLRQVIVFDQVTLPGVDMTLAALEARGAAAETDETIERYRADAMTVKADDLATIIYTSGTTGEPKGAMLSHGNFASNVNSVRDVIEFRPTDVALSFLPLSHVFERMLDYLFFATGVSIAYAESIDTLTVNFGEVHPTLVASVPRVYEKIYARVLENAVAAGGLKSRIFTWARGIGDRAATVRLEGREPDVLLGLRHKIADKLVFSKLRDRVGGRLRYFVSGGAPLAGEINKFFYAAGLTILEGYGLTETSPVISVNTPADLRIGTVGKPIPGVEVRIAPDGEILTRGPHVMKGYFNKPEATREAIDTEGWFHTGDIGVLEDGFLRITDRKKDIIVTAGGKNIAPQPIEGQVKLSKFVLQAVMIGDKRKFPVMLVVPNFEQLDKWAKEQNMTWSSHQELLATPAVRSKMEKEVLSTISGLASYEMPKKVGLLEHDFTIESGELTPTMKVKRRVVDARYKTLIDSLYADSAASSPAER